MTLNEYISMSSSLTDSARTQSQRTFLRKLSEHQNLDYIMYTVENLMADLVDLEDEDFFGTEGMDI